MSLAAARQVADAVLYEGYLLYPYRASSSKNVMRWQFGVLGPEGAMEVGVGEASTMAAEMLVEPAAGASIDVHLRFLQVQARTVERRTDSGWAAVEELMVAGSRWIPYHEAVSREVSLCALSLAAQTLEVGVPGGEETEELVDGGEVVGRLIRQRWPVSATLTLTPRVGADRRLVVLGLRVDNTTPWSVGSVAGWSDRDVAARYSLVGTHLLLSGQDAGFVSLLEGPDFSDADARTCRQERCWPVLIATDDGRDAVLVAPIILGDHPRIAPESAGDLFDATEIDEILTLRVMTMTEAEKADARGTDPRAAAILARCDAMSDEAMGRLHGAQRFPSEEQFPVMRDTVTVDAVMEDTVMEDTVPWWDAAEDARAAPESDVVMIGGVPVSQGSRVLLRPTRRADAQDLFLAGLTALVSRVYFDVDGGTHLAVMLEDDPGRDLYGVTGRYYYFGPEEVEPLPAREGAT